MKTSESSRKLAYFLIACIFVISSCQEDTPTPQGPVIPQEILTVNKFIYENMSTYYLWNEQMPDIDYRKQEDPEKYFDTLLYKPLDRWSFITDDYAALAASYQGVSESMGHSFELHYYSNSTSDIYGIIQFVYPNSPASEAGLQRGDFFTAIDGTDLNLSNYASLLDKKEYTLTIAKAQDGVVVPVRQVKLTAREIKENPILLCDTIKLGGKTIGYMMYKNFYDNYNDSLKTAFDWLKSAKIDELVLDLRYNNGGAISSMQYLASLIAPSIQITRKDVILKTVYNSILTNAYNSQGISTTTNFKDVGLNLNLKKMYVLTGRNTASASEALIVGLKPYMSITTIGDKTHGKYTGAYLINDENGKHNWAIQPIVFKYSNSEGFTDFGNGLTPDITGEDGLFTPLGDPAEMLLALAIQEITGIPAPIKKSATIGGDESLIVSFDGNRIRNDIPLIAKPVLIK